MNGRIFRTMIAAITAVSGAVTVQASPNHGRIIGIVRTENGEPLSDVTVSVTGSNVMGERNTVTNRRGRFRFPVLPVGGYVLQFEHENMKTLVRSEVTVRPFGTVTVRLKMMEGSPDDVEHVTGPSDLIDVTTSSERNYKDADFMQRLPGS